ncbi:MAG: ABC transporter permease [Fidelibacterota bacterium]
MIKFVFKGILRDHHRSLFPVLIVTIGVALTVVAHSWVFGVFGDMIEFNAKYKTGHVSVMTHGYAENIDQMPNDYALVGVDSLVNILNKEFPTLRWAERIHFGGLIDIPNEEGETKVQGPAMGLALNILSDKSREIDRLNLKNALQRGQLPQKQGEILLSELFASKLGVNPGDMATIITSTMYGSMSIKNFVVSGTVEFGARAMDKGAVVADVKDAQYMLNMTDAAGELLGYFPEHYNSNRATTIKQQFNDTYSNPESELSPVMQTIEDDPFLGDYIEMGESMAGILIFVFILIMSIVLWNSGLLSALRRYGEVGVRLALGESKHHIYGTLIIESLIIGVIGSILGTGIGLIFANWLEQGIDIGSMLQNSTIMMPSVFRGQITPQTYYIGFIPGIFSTVLGTMLAGIGIYKRQTAQLFKELET